jgi:para-nitrobenzyl esterase
MKFIYTLTFIFITHLLSAQCGDRYKLEIFPSATRYFNIHYATNTNNLGEAQSLLMDVYTPTGDTASLRPLMIFVHGGSFISGNKDEFVSMASQFARKGYVAASINYRLHNGTNPIAPILDFADDKNWYRAIVRAVQDTKAAIRYFKKDAAENGNTYKIDTSNIILYGSSAGAINILHAVFMTDSAQISNRYREQSIVVLGGNCGIRNWKATEKFSQHRTLKQKSTCFGLK